MSCEQYSNLIDDLVEGELDQQTAGRVDSHVFTCTECRRKFDEIKREKEIYAQYLFEAEPPNELWANFQKRLETEKKKRKTSLFAQISANVSARKTNVSGAWRFSSPLLAGAVLMIVFGFGFGWLKFVSNKIDDNSFVVETSAGDSPLPPTFAVTDKSDTAASPVKADGGEKNAVFTQSNKSNGTDKSPKTKSAAVADKQLPFAKAIKIERKTASPNAEEKASAIENRLSEEARRESQSKNLDQEIAGQIEKVEILLRSFRNARTSETSATFDVEYEKGQARKLLENNVRLRRDAENYGGFYAEELLNRVEPYLLDIANLADHPAPDKVLDIRERVKNQSLIASLQVY